MQQTSGIIFTLLLSQFLHLSFPTYSSARQLVAFVSSDHVISNESCFHRARSLVFLTVNRHIRLDRAPLRTILRRDSAGSARASQSKTGYCKRQLRVAPTRYRS